MLIKCLGINDYYPLLINVLFVIVFVVSAHQLFKEYGTIAYLILLSLMLWLPLVYVQVLSGMEHVVHIVFTLLFIIQVKRYFQIGSIQGFAGLCLLASIAVMTRYESLFFVFPVCMLLLLRKAFIQSVVLGMVAVLPVVLYGYLSIKNGADFLPNSLLIKGNVTVSIWQLFQGLLTNMADNLYLIPIIIGNLLIIHHRVSEGNENRVAKLVNKCPVQVVTLITILDTCYPCQIWVAFSV